MKKKVVQIVCVIVFIFSAVMLGQYAYTYIEVESQLNEVQQVYSGSVEKEQQEEAKEYAVRERFQELLRLNERIVGWIALNGTKLDNPIMHAEDNEFYLHHNYLDEENRAGSIFMDFRNDFKELGIHTILYGHVMRNESMFGGLSNFSDQTYAEEHAVISFDILYTSYELYILTAYKTTTDFYYIETDFTEESYGDFLNDITSRSEISMPIKVNTTDRIVTLSTCTISPNDNERFVVHAKVVEN
ncbi:class B sortase [Lysinibacillus sp. 54212]|uniref:class B sortase n=1 Tax=Lysinibacillus sp. 54212 TaxID=3119829 RepID=UPI002FC82CA0